MYGGSRKDAMHPPKKNSAFVEMGPSTICPYFAYKKMCCGTIGHIRPRVHPYYLYKLGMHIT